MRSGPRVMRADRQQLYWDMVDLCSQIAPDHPARVVWASVERLELAPPYDRIKGREEAAGRPTPDPKVLPAVWPHAALEGVGSARQLERLSRAHVAYRWLRGGVPVNYHGLRRFFLRGLTKARCEALLHSIAHNLRRGHALRMASA